MKIVRIVFAVVICALAHSSIYAQAIVSTNLYGSPIENEKGMRINYSQSELETIQKISKDSKPFSQQRVSQVSNMLKTPVDASVSSVYSIMGACIGRKSMHTLDVDGDGATEIVCSATTGTFGAGNFWYILGYDAVDKDWKKEWNSATYDALINCIEVFDYDKDGTQEVLIGLATGKVLIVNAKTRVVEGEFTVASADIKSIIVADADNDSANDIVLSTATATYIVSATTFATKYTINQGASEVRVGVLDNSGKNEIVLSSGSVYKLIGTVLTTEWSGFTTSSSGYYSTECIELADIDNDSKQEIVLAQSWYYIYVYDVDTKTTKYSIKADLDIQSLLLADMSGDGVDDIIYGDGQWGELHCYNSVTRAKLWEVRNPEHGVAAINYADANGDGVKELIWSAGWTSTGADYMYVYSLAESKTLWQSKDVRGPFYGVATGDVDGDGKIEIVTVSYESGSGYESGVLVILDAITHKVKWESSGSLFRNTWRGVKTVEIADVDNDGQNEIVIATSEVYTGAVYIIDGKTHTIKSKKVFSTEGYNGFEALAIDDVDANTIKELYVVDDKNLYAINPTLGIANWNVAIVSSYNSTGKTIKVADLTGDGVKEIITCTGSLQVVNSVDHSYWRIPESIYNNIDIYDYNKDGRLDIVACTSSGKIEVIDGTTRAKLLSISPESSSINAVRAITFNQQPGFVYSANNKVNVYQNATTCAETQVVSSSLGLGNSFQVLQSGGNAIELLTGTAVGVSKVGINCIQVSTNTLYLKAPAYSTATFTITYPGAWTIRGDQSWLGVNQFTGTGNATITVRALTRLLSGSRSGVIAITTPNGISQYINVIQDAATAFFNVTPTSLTVKSFDRSVVTFSISSNVNWTISGGASWAKADVLTGGGSATIIVTADQNNVTSERSCTFTISSAGITSKTVTLRQEAAVVSLEVSAPFITVGPEASKLNTFTINTTVAWSATTDQSWVRLTPNTATGSKTVALDIDANLTTQQRKTVITIKGVGVPDRTVVIYQNGMLPMLEVNPANLTVPAKGNLSGVFKVKSNSPWRADCYSSWVRFSALSGSNDVDVTYTCNENNTLNSRNAIVYFSNDKGLTTKLTLFQQAGTAYLTVSTNSLTVPNASCDRTVEVQSNMAWNVMSNQSWIQPNLTTGYANATLKFNIAANNSSTARAGSVILYGTNLSPQVITILQDVTSTVQANSTTQAHVYPSIFKNNVYVAQAEVGAKLSIFTMQCRQVLEQVVHTNNQSIPTQNLASGIYVVRLQQSSGIVTQRIVKE